MRSNRFFSTLAFLAALTASSGWAADHREAPALSLDPSGDITDVYAFVSPNNPNNVVFVLNLYPEAPDDAAFPKRGIQFHFDLDGDAWQDRTFTFKFGNQKKNGTQKFKASFDGSPDSSLNRKLIKGKTTAHGEPPNVIDARQGITAFAGPRDDPFFADVRAVDGPFFCPPGRDSYAGDNILSIVLELPPKVFGPGVTRVPPLGVWAETKRDSLGAPLTNELLIPPNKLIATGNRRDKDRFNSTHPHEQESGFFEPVRRTFGVLNNPSAADQLARDTFPDLLFLDPNQPGGWPNGRRLEDDVVDIALRNITAGVESTDCVPGNDAPFNQVFPYLAEPHSR